MTEQLVTRPTAQPGGKSTAYAETARGSHSAPSLLTRLKANGINDALDVSEMTSGLDIKSKAGARATHTLEVEGVGDADGVVEGEDEGELEGEREADGDGDRDPVLEEVDDGDRDSERVDEMVGDGDGDGDGEYVYSDALGTLHFRAKYSSTASASDALSSSAKCKYS